MWCYGTKTGRLATVSYDCAGMVMIQVHQQSGSVVQHYGNDTDFQQSVMAVFWKANYIDFQQSNMAVCHCVNDSGFLRSLVQLYGAMVMNRLSTICYFCVVVSLQYRFPKSNTI